MNPYVNLAKKTIETFVKEGKIINPPSDLPKEMLENEAGVFVSLHLKENDELRGCIGTIIPIKKNVAEEIIHNTISAATRDPRFSPITKEEIEQLSYSVDILSEPESVKDLHKLNPKKDGLIIKTPDGRSGLLLPNLEGVDTVEKQMEICCMKGGINPSVDPIICYKFNVKRFKE